MFVCSKCPREFKKKFACERHEKSIHGLQKTVKTTPFVCSVCSKSFLYKRSLDFHVKSHGNLVRKEIAECETPPDTANKATASHGKNIEDLPELKGHLPEGYDYTVEKYEKLDNGFIARILFPVPTVDTADKFYSEYLTKSKQRYRTAKIERRPSKNIIIRKSYHCHHDAQRKGEKNRKNTNCPARLYISVKSNKESFSCAVTCNISHNHRSDNAAALRLLLPSEEVVEKFRKMFEAGFSPSKALKQHEQDLLLEYGDEYYIVAADRTILPEASWVYHYYYKIFKQNYGESHGDSMLKALSEAVSNINKDSDIPSAKINVHEDSSFTVAVMTPLMRRVSETPLAGDIAFIDSTGNVDRFGCRVFLMISPSCVGGLPHGALLTTSESEDSITESLECYKSLLTDKSYGGRGKKGPAIIMTDDSDAERNSLKTVFPCAILLLCIFHVLQAVWRWLLDSTNSIAAYHRPTLFQKMKGLMYSKTKEDLDVNIKNFRADALLKQYHNFAYYLERWLKLKEAWAICLRKNEKLRGQHTNNLNEAANKIFIEKVLDRVKAFSPVQLLDFLVKDFNAFYERKILKAAAGRPDAYLIRKETKLKFNVEDYTVEVIINDLIYEINNLKNGKQYLYNLELNCCTCPVGDYGSICKHYRILKKLVKFKKHELDLPKSEAEKNLLHYIATGSVCQRKDWYGELVPSNSSEEIIGESDNVDSITNTNDDSGIDMSLQISQCTDEKSTNSDDSKHEHEKMETLEKFKQSLESIIAKVENDPNSYFKAAAAFVKSCEKIKTDASLISALHCFGKFNGLKRKKLRNSTRIGVQSTAPSRRKTSCGGRANLQSGRPPKWARAPQHAYSNDKKNKDRLMPQFKKKRKAPHNLQNSVDENRANGK